MFCRNVRVRVGARVRASRSIADNLSQRDAHHDRGPVIRVIPHLVWVLARRVRGWLWLCGVGVGAGIADREIVTGLGSGLGLGLGLGLGRL